MKFTIVTIACVVACVYSESANFYQCPEIEVMQGFDKDLFLSGGWYEIGHYGQTLQDEDVSCLYSEYKHKESENWYSNDYLMSKPVKRESVFVNQVGELDCSVDELTPKYDTSSGIIQFTRSYLDPSAYEGMRVIATDYENYAVLHECDSDGLERMQILSRRPFMEESYIDFIKKVMEYKASDFSLFVRTDNFGTCPYRNVKKTDSTSDQSIAREATEERKQVWW